MLLSHYNYYRHPLKKLITQILRLIYVIECELLSTGLLFFNHTKSGHTGWWKTSGPSANVSQKHVAILVTNAHNLLNLYGHKTQQ